MPHPLSLTRMIPSPPCVASTVPWVAPASRAFSTSSFTAEAGRSTTSPAAIFATRSGARRWIGKTHLPGALYRGSFRHPPGGLLLRSDPAVGALAQRLMIGVGGHEEARLDELGVVRLRLRKGLSLEKALELYDRLPGVDYVEPNYRLQAELVPNDPLYAAQRWYYNLTEAPQAWDVEEGTASVIVAVLDSGVDTTHLDLRDRIWRNPGEGVPHGIDEDGNGCADDVHGC